MSNNGLKIFPRRKGCSNRSCKIEVGCGEAGLITGFNLPEGVSICFNVVESDPCGCDPLEKEYCQLGERAGINDEQCTGVLGMPGCYVGVLCIPTDEDGDPIELPTHGWGVYVNVCAAHDNLQTMAAMAALGD